MKALREPRGRLPFAVYVSLGDEPARLKHSGDALARARVASGAPAAEVEDALAAAPGSLSIEELGSTRGTIQEVRGELAAREGRAEEARAALAEAHRIYADMGANGHAARTAGSL